MSAFSYRQGCRGRAGRFGLRLTFFCLFALLLTAAPSFGQTEDDSAATSQPKAAAHGSVYISDVQAGFAEGGRSLVREDYSVPVRVSLVNRSPEIFTGTVQIIGHDRDWETVIYERPGIGIKPADSIDIVMSWFARSGSAGLAANPGDMTVRLLDKDGKLVHSLDVPLDYSPDNEYLIVDISQQTIKGPIQAVLFDDPKLKYRGRVRTGTLRPADVPTSWYDLEAADVIVCDRPDDAKLSVDQWNAVAQWVRQGGLLVLGPGSLQSLQQTELAKELPAAAETMTKVTAQGFRTDRNTAAAEADTLASPDGSAVPEALGIGNSRLTFNWTKEIGVWQLRPRQDATILLQLPLKQGPWPVIVRRRLGTGSIVQSAMSLSFLLSPQAEEGVKAGGNGARIKPELFGIRTSDISDEMFGKQDMSWNLPWPNQYGPRDLIKGEADFRAVGTVLAVLLLLLTILYGLIVTVGTWLVLRYRKLTQFSWLAFGIVAAIGSVGAAFLVQGARGISAEVKQQSVVDLDAASGMASVHTFYGLRMPYDARVSIGITAQRADELPPEEARHAYIRPAADLQTGATDSFAVRRDYTIRHGQPTLNDVPIRATAKQFESYWYGSPSGTIQGMIVLENNGNDVSSRSWISNQTDMPLRECVLIFSTVPAFNTKSRSLFMRIAPIGKLPAGKVRSDLSEAFGTGGQAGEDSRLDAVGQRWLTKMPWNVMQQVQFGRSQAVQEAIDRSDRTQSLTAAMVTLLSDLPSVKQEGYSPFGNASNYLIPFSHLPRSGGKWLDMRYVLDGKAAILIGLADSPGPTRLKVNGKAVEPSSGECIVRAVIPLVGASN